MLDWVFWIASPFIRAWHRYRVVLASIPYGWVTHTQKVSDLIFRKVTVSYLQRA